MPLFLLTTLFIVGMVLVCLEFGLRFRIRHRQEQPSAGLGVIDGAVFGLMGLILGFTFSGAENRFEARRQLIVQETNAIGTAYLRVDLLPAAAQPELRRDFRDYVDARIAFYRQLHEDNTQDSVALDRADSLQKKIWSETVAACQQANNPAVVSLAISSLNDMIDITTTRAVAQRTHPPLAIYFTLFALALTSSLIAGFGMGDIGKRSWLHTLVYATALTVTIYTILDLEFPRMGIIRIDRYDQVLIDQRNSMNDGK